MPIKPSKPRREISNFTALTSALQVVKVLGVQTAVSLTSKKGRDEFVVSLIAELSDDQKQKELSQKAEQVMAIVSKASAKSNADTSNTKSPATPAKTARSKEDELTSESLDELEKAFDAEEIVRKLQKLTKGGDKEKAGLNSVARLLMQHSKEKIAELTQKLQQILTVNERLTTLQEKLKQHIREYTDEQADTTATASTLKEIEAEAEKLASAYDSTLANRDALPFFLHLVVNRQAEIRIERASLEDLEQKFSSNENIPVYQEGAVRKLNLTSDPEEAKAIEKTWRDLFSEQQTKQKFGLLATVVSAATNATISAVGSLATWTGLVEDRETRVARFRADMQMRMLARNRALGKEEESLKNNQQCLSDAISNLDEGQHSARVVQEVARETHRTVTTLQSNSSQIIMQLSQLSVAIDKCLGIRQKVVEYLPRLAAALFDTQYLVAAQALKTALATGSAEKAKKALGEFKTTTDSLLKDEKSKDRSTKMKAEVAKVVEQAEATITAASRPTAPTPRPGGSSAPPAA